MACALPVLSCGCEAYIGIPHATILGQENGVLTDNKKPLTVVFDKAIVASSLQIKVARLTLDAEGNLPDEDADDLTKLEPLFSFDGTLPPEEQVVGGTATVSEGLTRLTITPEKAFPLAENLVLIIEPGLTDGNGHTTALRELIPFSYEVKLNCAPAPDFPSGGYFFLANVENPIAVQVQLFAYIEVNPETGEFVGEFVNADRNRNVDDCKPFGLMCDDTEACRTLPEPACVAPSEKAASEDEYPDYVVNYDPPAGYSFTVKGCVDGSGDKIVFVNVPVDVSVQQPKVSLTGTVITAAFEKDAEGVMRGAGTIAVEQVLLGTIDSGKADGSAIARNIPAGEEPEGLKQPAPQ